MAKEKKGKTFQVQVRMNEDAYLKLKQLADDNGLALATFIRSTLIQYTKGTLGELDEETLKKLNLLVSTKPDVNVF
jgi:hypothetical protein